MADELYTPENEGGPRFLHPADQFPALCVDVIDVGFRVKKGQPGKLDKLQQRVALVFRTGVKHPETGNYVDVSKEFAVSMFKGQGGNMSPLRLTLEQWRGEPYPEENPRVPMHKLEGRPALIQIVHEPSPDGSRVYANINSVTKLPNGLSVPQLGVYTRAPYWAERKDKYAKAAAEFRRLNPVPNEALPESNNDGSDGLPF